MVKKGRYGPYVSHAGVNATLPADVEPDKVTLEQAVELLAARAAKTGATTGDAPRARRTSPRRAKPATTPAPAAAKKPKPAKAVAKAMRRIVAEHLVPLAILPHPIDAVVPPVAPQFAQLKGIDMNAVGVRLPQ